MIFPTRLLARCVGFLVLMLSVATAIYNLAAWTDERAWARYVAATVHATDTASTITALARLTDARVSLERGDEPFLRWPAMRTWLTGKGDCASAARAMIIVLDVLGIDAHRLIVGGHTALAYRDGDVWRASPGVRAPDWWAVETRLHPPLDRLEQDFTLWNWARLSLDVRQTTPFPHWLVLIFESPALIGVILSVLAGCGAFVLVRR